MVTWANDHYYDFVMNWVTHLKKLNVRPAPLAWPGSSSLADSCAARVALR